jgi:hypothetical protein
VAIRRININLLDLLGVGLGNFSFLSQVSSKPEVIDEYSFITPFGKSVSISVTHERRSKGGDADLRVFDDRNGNGRLDTNGSEPALAQSTQRFGLNEFISFRGVTGNKYLIGVVNNRGFAPNGSVFYTLRAAASDFGAPNPLAGKEIQLGTIAQDLQRSNRVNDNDTADNYAFTLDGSSSLNIGVRELGKKGKGDANIRVVQDFNGNGFVDEGEGEVVVKGISTRNGSVDTITGLNKAGDYILQVCQTNGDSRFGVNFDHSAV